MIQVVRDIPYSWDVLKMKSRYNPYKYLMFLLNEYKRMTDLQQLLANTPEELGPKVRNMCLGKIFNESL